MAKGNSTTTFMNKKIFISGIGICAIALSFSCILTLNSKKVLNLESNKAEEDLYSLTLDDSNPHSGGTSFVARTKSGNNITFYGENLTSGQLNEYFVKLSTTNKGYIGNGISSGGMYENALSNLTYVNVVYESDSANNVGTLTLTTGIDASHLFERHYLTSGNGVNLNTPANYFRITADKAYTSDCDNIIIKSIVLNYSDSCATGEYATAYGLAPANQNRYCTLKLLQLDLSAYSSVLNTGNFTPKDLSVIKYTPKGGVTRNLSNKSNDFAYLNSQYYLDFNSGWLSSQTTGKGWDGYSLFDDGDVLTIEGSFVGTASTNMGQEFYIPKSQFIFKSIEGVNYIYNYVPIESINTTTGQWFTNRGMQFYTYDNFVSQGSDITNVGKLKPYHADSVTLKRGGHSFSIGTENSGWYCLTKLPKQKGLTYQLELCQGSINMGDADSVRGGDIIILDGLFIADSYDLVYIDGYSAKFNYTDAWSVEQVTESKDENVAKNRLNIGFWNGNYHFDSVSKLQTIADMGINVLICVNPVWNPNWNNILDATLDMGIQFIVDPRSYDSVNGGYLPWDGTCPSYANHPAVMGFFIYDEPNTTKFDDVAAALQQFKSVMPQDKIFFVNLLSGACGLEGLYGPGSYSESLASKYEDNYVNVFAEKVDADVYSFDSYPLFVDGDIRKSYFCSFDVWSYRSKQDDIPLWYTLLACAHDSGDAGKIYVTPNKEQIRWQMSVGLSYGVDGLMGYLYAHSADGNYVAMADNSGNIINQQLYDDYSDVVKEYRNWDEEYKDFVWQGTAYHDEGSTNMMFQNLKHKINLSTYSTSVTSSEDLLIGVFKNKYTDRTGYMITNAGSAPRSNLYSYTRYNYNLPFSYTDSNVTITFDDTYKGVYIYEDGVKRYQAINSNSLTLVVKQLDGVFVIPTNN